MRNNLSRNLPFPAFSRRQDMSGNEQEGGNANPAVAGAAPQADRWPQIQAFLVQIFTADTGNGTNAEADATQNAPHSDFWSNFTYDQFVNGNVPGVTDPNSGSALPILVKGNSQGSNIVMALLGTPGSLFDPKTGAIGQMPQGF